jgi:IclR family pca regulon transcriptional regulator
VFIESIRKAMAVLEAFEPDAASLSLSELARRTGMTMASAQRVMHTLAELGYLEKDPDRKLYRISPRILRLGRSYMQSIDLQRASEVPMRALADRVAQTVNVTVRSGTEIVYVLRLPRGDVVAMPSLWIGSTLPIQYTSMGRVMVAYLPNPERDDLLDQLEFPFTTNAREVSREGFVEDLRVVRDRGYAINDRDLRPDLRSVAAPVFAHDGSCVAALGVAVRAGQYRVADLEKEIVPLLRHAAEDISRNLGFEPMGERSAMAN